ncbi:MAG: hypothetical protein WC047_00040 [Kiritimatiellales bacterium]
MTIALAISETDALKPNQYTTAQKIKWLSELDLKIKLEIINAHEGYETIPDLGLDDDGEQIPFVGYTDATDTSTVLLAPDPYSIIYSHWLCAKIDYYNNEITRYNNTVMMYNTALQEYSAWYNRTVLPRQPNTIYV